MKMYKQSQHLTSLVLVMVLIIALTSSAFAADTRSDPRISSSNANVLRGNDTLEIFFSITASSTMNTLGATRIVIQWDDGSNWITEDILSVTGYPNMQTVNATYHTALIRYTPLRPGKTYRAVVYLFATDDAGTSTHTEYGY